jgi:hypothetical protein
VRAQVYITAAAAGEREAAGHAAKYDSYALDKISIRVSPRVFGARIRCGYLFFSLLGAGAPAVRRL